MIHIGIDPGASGSVCVIEDEAIGFYDIPELKKVLGQYVMHEVKITIERQGTRKNQAGMGKMMRDYGFLLGTIDVFDGDVTEIRSQDWYKMYGIPSGMDRGLRKKKTAAIMEEKFPMVKSLFYGPRGGLLDGRTDALAIANFGKGRDS